MGPYSDRTVVLIRRSRDESNFFLCVHRGKARWGSKEMVPPCQLRREAYWKLTRSCWLPELRFPTSRTVRKYVSIVYFFYLFLLVGGQLLYNIVVVFVIHWHESAMDLHIFPIPIPPPTSLSTRSLWVFPVHQPWALVSCIQPGLVVCFTLDSILVSMLFSLNIPPSPSPTESESLFCTSVSLFSVLHIGLSSPSF